MIKEIKESQHRLFTLETVAAGEFVLGCNHQAGEIKLILDSLTELAHFLSEIAEEEQAAFQEYLEMEYSDYQKDTQQWRNFTTTGDPDVSPEEMYKYENI